MIRRRAFHLAGGAAVDVGDWLRNLGLERYEAAFHENGVDVEVLRHLIADDLSHLGVSAVGHRRRLLVAIAKLSEASGAPQKGAPTEDWAAPSTAERRHITVMFCDIVGSTPLSAALDPEELRELLSAYQGKVAEAVTVEHGFIARFVGDGVLAYFGWPNADEAQAESSVSAALAIVEAVRAQHLSVRIGIATGLVVTGDLVGVGAAQTITAVGKTPNLAARLQALAQPDTIVVSDATRSQLGRMFELEDLGPQWALAVPDTLQASLMARLDRLPAAKTVAQIGSVIGREFPHTLVEAVAGLPDARLAEGTQRTDRRGAFV